MARLRLGKWSLHHYLHAINRHETGLGDTCGVPKTIEHHLLEWQNDTIRQVKAKCREVALQPNLQNILNRDCSVNVLTENRLYRGCERVEKNKQQKSVANYRWNGNWRKTPTKQTVTSVKYQWLLLHFHTSSFPWITHALKNMMVRTPVFRANFLKFCGSVSEIPRHDVVKRVTVPRRSTAWCSLMKIIKCLNFLAIFNIYQTLLWAILSNLCEACKWDWN